MKYATIEGPGMVLPNLPSYVSSLENKLQGITRLDYRDAIKAQDALREEKVDLILLSPYFPTQIGISDDYEEPYRPAYDIITSVRAERSVNKRTPLIVIATMEPEEDLVFPEAEQAFLDKGATAYYHAIVEDKKSIDKRVDEILGYIQLLN